MTRRLDPEQLLQHTGWLRHLAFSLVGDAHHAEDVVQETYLVALERGPEIVDERGLRAWLAEVARNFARMRKRSERRRAAHESRAPERSGGAAIDEALEGVAAQRELVDAVLSLAPADREVIVLRYFEELPPREIARQLNTTGPAVRSRLTRALEKLRGRLREGSAARGGQWAAWLLPLARRAPVKVTMAGGWIMNATAKWVLGVSTFVALGVLFAIWEPAAPVSPDTGAVGLAPKEADLQGTKRSTQEATPESTQERVAVEAGVADKEESEQAATTTSPHERVVVQARCIDDKGKPLAGATLTATDLVEPITAMSDASGRVRLEIPWPMDLATGNEHWAVVEASKPGWTRQYHQERLKGPELLEIGDLQLVPGGDLVGRVVNAAGEPMANVLVSPIGEVEPASTADSESRRLYGATLPWLGYLFHARTGADGRYRIAGVPAQRLCVAARTSRHFVALTTSFELLAGATAEAPDLVMEPVGPENLITGVVEGPEGPQAGVWVSAFANRGARNIEPQAGPSITGEDGRFVLTVISAQTFTLEAELQNSHGFYVLEHDVQSGAEVRLLLPEQRRMHVVVEGPDGDAIDGARLQLFEHEPSFGISTWTEPHPGGGLWLNLPAQEFRFTIKAPGFETGEVGPFGPESAQDRLVVRLERSGSLRGQVTADGAPVPNAEVHLHSPPRFHPMVKFADDLLSLWDSHYGRPPGVKADAQGMFELPFTGAGRFLVHASAPGYAPGELGPFKVSEGEVLQGLEFELTRGAGLEGRILVAEGIDVVGMIVAICHADGHVRSAVVGPDGRYRFELLTPGAWQVVRGTADNQDWLRTSAQWPVYEEDAEVPVHVTLADGETRTYDLDFHLRDALHPRRASGTRRRRALGLVCATELRRALLRARPAR